MRGNSNNFRLLLLLGFGIWGLIGPGPASAQNPFIFDEKLFNVSDQALFHNQLLTAGQANWNVSILGDGGLSVLAEEFFRQDASSASTGTVGLTEAAFTPFVSDSWILRAVVRGTNPSSNTPFNYLQLKVDSPGGAYGWKILINRTNGNGDFNFGENASFNDLFFADVFSFNQLVNRQIRMSFVNRGSTIYAFVDDCFPYASPTNLVRSSAPTTGTLGTQSWDTVDILMGSQFTGTVDDIQLYNVQPFIETFLTSPTTAVIDPIPVVSAYDNTWTVVDANSPVQWRVANQRLEFKASGATNDPHIESSSPETIFTSASWTFETTFTIGSAVNLADNRIIFEILSTTPGSNIGIVVPRNASAGQRLLVYVGNESNIVATAGGGSDVIPNLRTRISAAYSGSQLSVKVNDRMIFVDDPTLGVGSRDWTGIAVKGDQLYPFTVDSFLFYHAGEGLLSAPSEWSLYE